MLSSGPSFLPVDASLSPHGLPGSQLFLIYTGTWKGKQGSKTSESLGERFWGQMGICFTVFGLPNSNNPTVFVQGFTVSALRKP